MAYSATNWKDYPDLSTAIDASRLNNMEAGIVAAYEKGAGGLLNVDIDPAAAIAYLKLALAASIVNADVSPSAAIGRSKLNFGSGLVNADIATSAAISASKLAGFILATKTAAKTVNTTVAATDLLNNEFIFDPVWLGTQHKVRLTAWGDFLNNSGGAVALPQISVWIGPGANTQVITTNAAGSATNSATRFPWRLVFEIEQLASASSQRCTLHWVGGMAVTTLPAAAFTVGVGSFAGFGSGSTGIYHAFGGNTSAVTTSGAGQQIALLVTNGSANALYETKLIGAMLEGIQ